MKTNIYRNDSTGTMAFRREDGLEVISKLVEGERKVWTYDQVGTLSNPLAGVVARDINWTLLDLSEQAGWAPSEWLPGDGNDVSTDSEVVDIECGMMARLAMSPCL